MLIEFAIITDEFNDHALLDAVISHPRYRDHCAGPFAGQDHHDLHGPYRVQSISADGFAPSTTADALQVLQWWPATDLYPQYADAVQRSKEILGAWVAPILAHATAIYRLAVPREGNEHDWGWIVGTHGFHEYVAINRRKHGVTLIIAGDD